MDYVIPEFGLGVRDMGLNLVSRVHTEQIGKWQNCLELLVFESLHFSFLCELCELCELYKGKIQQPSRDSTLLLLPRIQ